ncbi:MAG: Trk system potassium transporter TrkA [Clostridiales bacterium]|nr:Trk system potassium transporter TrkA [Clostridiales bacterium]
MNMIIVGCGKIGSTLAEELSQEDCDITVIDTERSKVQRIADNCDVMGVVGNGTSFQLLEEAGIGACDVFIAVTGQDEVNLLCCVVAKKAGHGITTIARVRDFTYHEERTYLQQSLGISMLINPELTAATEIARRLRTPKAIDISTFAEGRAELLTFPLERRSPLVDLPINRMNQKLGTDILVCAVERERKALIPKGDFVFQEGDKVSIVGSPQSTSLFFQRIGMASGQAKDTMILGGGRIAYYLACQLAGMKINIKILEADEDRCAYLSEALPSAMVIHASSRNRDVLLEEGLESAQSVVALTNVDEENLMLSMLASIYNPKGKRVTKVSDMPFSEVLERMDLGSIICPRELAARQIVQYIRAMQNSKSSNVETAYPILDGKAEVLSFRLEGASPLLNIPLMELPIRDDLLVSAIIRKGRVFNPRGSDSLKRDDTMIVVTSHKGIRELSDILRPGAAIIGRLGKLTEEEGRR